MVYYYPHEYKCLKCEETFLYGKSDSMFPAPVCPSCFKEWLEETFPAKDLGQKTPFPQLKNKS